MFDFLREIKDNICAELALAAPCNVDDRTKEKIVSAIHNEDGRLCMAIEDSATFICHGRVLNEIEKSGLTVYDDPNVIASKTGLPVEMIIKTIEAEKTVLFLRSKLYDPKQIILIGNISRKLERNNGDVDKTAADMKVSKDVVEVVIGLINEYISSFDGNVHLDSASNNFAEASKEEKQPTTKPFEVYAPA